MSDACRQGRLTRRSITVAIIAVALLGGTTDSVTAQFFGKGNARRDATGPLGTSVAKSEDEAETRDNRSAPTQRQLKIVLREGTFVGPLRGRFVLRGQRWAFLVDGFVASSDDGKSKWVDSGLAREILPDQDTILGRPRPPATDAAELHRDSRSLRLPRTGLASGLGPGSTPPAAAGTEGLSFESILVNENLMLDRIARAIEEDPHDVFWTITGTVTEFQDENRLLVLTANRTRRVSAPSF